MSNKKLGLYFLLFAVLIFPSCLTPLSQSKKTYNPPKKVSIDPSLKAKQTLLINLLDSVSNNKLKKKIRGIKLKAKLTYRQYKKQNITLFFRMEYGKKIWCSIQSFIGTELFRVMIDEDKILWINRLEKEYGEWSLSKFFIENESQKYILTLQNALLGNISSTMKNNLLMNAKISEQGSIFISKLSQKENIEIIFSPFYILQNLYFDWKKYAINFHYKKWKKATLAKEHYKYPERFEINFLYQTEPVTLELENHKFSFKETSFPFKIPKKFNQHTKNE